MTLRELKEAIDAEFARGTHYLTPVRVGHRDMSPEIGMKDMTMPVLAVTNVNGRVMIETLPPVPRDEG